MAPEQRYSAISDSLSHPIFCANFRCDFDLGIGRSRVTRNLQCMFLFCDPFVLNSQRLEESVMLLFQNQFLDFQSDQCSCRISRTLLRLCDCQSVCICELDRLLFWSGCLVFSLRLHFRLNNGSLKACSSDSYGLLCARHGNTLGRRLQSRQVPAVVLVSARLCASHRPWMGMVLEHCDSPIDH